MSDIKNEIIADLQRINNELQKALDGDVKTAISGAYADGEAAGRLMERRCINRRVKVLYDAVGVLLRDYRENLYDDDDGEKNNLLDLVVAYNDLEKAGGVSY